MSLRDEIQDQPQVFARLLREQRQNVTEIAAAIRAADPCFAFFAARGTSDNAARYANYLWSARNQLPVALATPSLFTIYQQPPRLRSALAVAVSQSGQSPDVVTVLEEARRQGCPTLALTNETASPLAQAADHVIDLSAGVEKAVAATKTYTAELMALAMLSAALGGRPEDWDVLARVPEWAQQALDLAFAREQAAERYRYLTRCVVLGRGYQYATAFEWALKLKELTYTIAEPYSTADFMHGPIAMVEPGFAVLAIAPSGAVYPDMLAMVRSLRQDQGAELVVVSDQDEALALAQTPLRMPAGVPEWIAPLITILPAQVFAMSLTSVKGLNPEQPRTIHKVTETV